MHVSALHKCTHGLYWLDRIDLLADIVEKLRGYSTQMDFNKPIGTGRTVSLNYIAIQESKSIRTRMLRMVGFLVRNAINQ